MYQHFPHIMYYIWLLMIVTSCTAAQRCADSSNKNTYTRTTYRVSDEDFNSLFTNAVVTTSKINCLNLCRANRTNTYYESNTKRCRCQGVCIMFNPVSAGRNYVEKYYISGKSLSIHSNMSFLSYFEGQALICLFSNELHHFPYLQLYPV